MDPGPPEREDGQVSSRNHRDPTPKLKISSTAEDILSIFCYFFRASTVFGLGWTRIYVSAITKEQSISAEHLFY